MALVYIYYDEDETRRRTANTMTEREAVEVAKRIARGLSSASKYAWQRWRASGRQDAYLETKSMP